MSLTSGIAAMVGIAASAAISVVEATPPTLVPRPPAVGGSSACAPRSVVTRTLERKFAEQQIASMMLDDKVVLELWGRPDGASWSLITTLLDGTSCLVLAGRAIGVTGKPSTPAPCIPTRQLGKLDLLAGAAPWSEPDQLLPWQRRTDVVRSAEEHGGQ